MPPSFLFKRSEKKDKGGLNIFVPGGGRTRRTVANVPGILASTRLHHDTRTLPGSSIYSRSYAPTTPGISVTYRERYPQSIGGETGWGDGTHSLIYEMERLSQVVKGLGSPMSQRFGIDSQPGILHPPLTNNTLTPRLSQGFSKLNEAIAIFCDDIAGWTLQNWPFDGTNEPTTENVEDMAALKASFPQGDSVPSMLLSRMNSPRPLDDVINYGLRSIISKVFHQEIFNPFHPSLSLTIGGETAAQRSEYLKELYNMTSSEEDDVDIMSWRAGTYKAHGIQAGQDFDATFITTLSSAIIKDHIDPFLQAIFGKRMHIFPVELRDITTVVRVAFDWNKSIKCLVPSIDLHTFIVPNNATFDAEMMEYYEKPMSASRTNTIICAGSIGLKLCDHENPVGRILVRVKVLTPQNYGDT